MVMAALRWLLLLTCLWTGASSARAEAFTVELSPAHAAFPRDDAPGVLVHGPDGFDADRPLHLVVFLHGYSGCARVLMGAGPIACRSGERASQGWNLAGHHDAAGRNTLLLIPQLAFMRRNGNPGCFARAGCFRRFIEEVLGAPALRPHIGATRTLAQVASITLAAHSAGFQAAQAILEHGQLDEHIHHVILLDALYAGAPAFARWLSTTPVPAPRLLSLYLGRGKTYAGSRTLLRRARRALGEEHVTSTDTGGITSALRDHKLTIAPARPPHRLVPAAHLESILAALPLPER